MKVSELAKRIEGEIVNSVDTDTEIACGLTCDLLSWVMTKGKPNCAWVTVQTHMNVVAVASLHDMAAIICPEGIAPEEESVKKAESEGIAVVKTKLTAYAVCVIMGKAGIPSA